TCAGLCSDYAYYATQYGRECWCGNNAAYNINGPGVCDFPCAGDASETCGGNFAMSVYSTGYLGCFADLQTGRVFPVVTGSNSMTTAICADTCAEYAYYGTQYGREPIPYRRHPSSSSNGCRQCWCGDNAAYDAYGEATCDMVCSGDATDTCGGTNAMSV
ncbi:unnamed protein product, partial [Ectocarpus sp. 4 AP-2014]